LKYLFNLALVQFQIGNSTRLKFEDCDPTGNFIADKQNPTGMIPKSTLPG
jgi:hypothetical protein